MADEIQSQLSRISRDAEERDAERRAKTLQIPYADLRKLPVSLEALKTIKETEAHAAKIAPIQIKVHDLAVAAADPTNPATQAVLADLRNRKFKLKLFVVSESSLGDAWEFYKFIPPLAESITGAVQVPQDILDKLNAELKDFKSTQEFFTGLDWEKETTTDLDQLIVVAALRMKASDLHFDARDGGAELRFRIDGLLHDVAFLPGRAYSHFLSRLKLVSELKLNIKDEPQDGRFTINIAGQETEVRVSIMPSEFGETVVLRILDPAGISVELPELGLRPDHLELVEAELARPNGLILNTGPTGSGKTTTLYAFLRHVLTPEIKIITVEDPIEYRIEGIEQTQVEPDAGYTFASGLRAILRQDPDSILVGEIRDGETADIALQAALTGHLVFSTLHTNDAVGAIPRLVDLGVKPQTIGPALTLIIAQRLVRRLCKHCKKSVPIEPDIKTKMLKLLDSLPPQVDTKSHREILEKGQWFQPAGCPECGGFGYRGRVGIFEFLRTAESNFQEAILKSVSHVELRKLAEAQSMTTMQADGVLKIISGLTTIEEVTDATGPIIWPV